MKFTLKDVRACLAYLHIQQIPFTIQDIKEGMNIELKNGTIGDIIEKNRWDTVEIAGVNDMILTNSKETKRLGKFKNKI